MRPGLFLSPGRACNDEVRIKNYFRMEGARMASENVSLKDYIIDMQSAAVKGSAQ